MHSILCKRCHTLMLSS